MLGILVALILLSAFFSSSETALMALNRYRLRHKAEAGHRGAQRALRLLEQPDRVLGLILLGNNFVNIVASSLATVISFQLGGETGIAIGAGLLTLVVLIFAEVAPKTFAAQRPESIAYFAANVYTVLLRFSYPLVWLVNTLANGVLYLLGLRSSSHAQDALSPEELRTVLRQAGQQIPAKQLEMLLNLIDLNAVTVEEVLIPRNELIGIDLDDHWPDILQAITTAPHAILPVYRGDIDQLVGTINLRRLVEQLRRNTFSQSDLEANIRSAYFVPENTPVFEQLLRFQHDRQQFGFLIDEYGDILGAVTLDDILEEIVGDMSQQTTIETPEIHFLGDNCYEVDGSTSLRTLQKQLDWDLPIETAKTLNGLILEQWQNLPAEGTQIHIADRDIDIIKVEEHAVRTVRIHPPHGKS